MTESNGNGKMDVLIDQVGRLTEGLTDMRSIADKQLTVAQTQAESVRQLVETVKKQAETNERQTKMLETLIGRQ